MALRPPRPRRRRSNPFGQSIPDDAIGAIAGFLLATTVARLLALATGLEHWTTTWQVLNALTVWMVWPFELLGLALEPLLVGLMRPVDLVMGMIVIFAAMFILATRTYRSRT